MWTLEILPQNDEVKSFYLERSNYSEDSGVDLVVPETFTINPTEASFFLGHKIQCRMVNSEGKATGYYLYARSSISKTPLMLANSVGIIDKNYTGEIKAALRLFSVNSYTVEKGSRLVQICAPDLGPVRVKIVDHLDETTRGANGFGSTGV